MQNSFLPLLALLFIGLKLTGYIAWTWLWVLAPIWVPLAVILGLCALWLIFLGVMAVCFGGRR